MTAASWVSFYSWNGIRGRRAQENMNLRSLNTFTTSILDTTTTYIYNNFGSWCSLQVCSLMLWSNKGKAMARKILAGSLSWHLLFLFLHMISLPTLQVRSISFCSYPRILCGLGFLLFLAKLVVSGRFRQYFISLQWSYLFKLTWSLKSAVATTACTRPWRTRAWHMQWILLM